MTYRSLHIVALALVSGVTLFAGQQRSLPPRAIITWHVQVEDADGPFGEFTIYRIRPRFVIAVSIVNITEASAVASVDPVAFARHVHITIERGAPIGTTIQWLNPENSTRQLAPGTGFTLRMAMRTTGEPLGPGLYVLRVGLDAEDLPEIASAPGLWSGKPVALASRLRIVDPQTPVERVAAHRQAARVALRSNQLVEAERQYRAALDIDADNAGTLIDLGGLYLRLAKYREAAGCLERVPLVGGDGGFVHLLLAQAYIGLGDDGRAVQVLTRAGLPNSMIATELERLKNAVARRQ
jgi:hypothetical protein